MAIRKEAYKIVLKVGNKFFAGHTENFLSVKPNFEPILKKSLGGKLIEEFVSFDLETGVSGFTYVKSAEEAVTHDDFQDIRITAASGGAVAFVFGEMADGKPIITGTGRIFDYFETEGSSTAAGSWGCKLRTLFGGAVSGTYEEPPVAEVMKYGLLYNYYTATDARNITAAGSHIPTMADFATLMRYLDPAGTSGANTAGGQMKETGVTYWNTPNTGASNSSLFNAKGAGERGAAAGIFGNFGVINYLWNAEELDASNGRISYLTNSNATFYTYYYGGYYSDKKNGHSIRPVMDSTTLTHGETGTYTGNDGKVYRTICIGTQEWVADNLAETKFRNGDDVPEITDNAAWAALVTAGMCAYNNDWSNAI